MKNRLSPLDKIVVSMVMSMLGFIAVLALALASTPAHAQSCEPGFEWHEPTQTCRVPCKIGEIRGEDGLCRQPLCPPNCQPGWPCDLEPGRAPADVVKRKGLTCRAVRVDFEPVCTKDARCEMALEEVRALLLTVLVSCGK